MTTATPEYHDGEIVTIRSFSRDNPAWSEAALRWLRFMESENGAADEAVFVAVGRRVLIDKAAFFRWIRKQQRRAA